MYGLMATRIRHTHWCPTGDKATSVEMVKIGTISAYKIIF